jgi:hypothetical protein
MANSVGGDCALVLVKMVDSARVLRERFVLRCRSQSTSRVHTTTHIHHAIGMNCLKLLVEVSYKASNLAIDKHLHTYGYLAPIRSTYSSIQYYTPGGKNTRTGSYIHTQS